MTVSADMGENSATGGTLAMCSPNVQKHPLTKRNTKRPIDLIAVTMAMPIMFNDFSNTMRKYIPNGIKLLWHVLLLISIGHRFR